jgi:rhodanese-related sulfurtransferase
MWELTPPEAYDAWQAGDLTIVDIREEREHAQTRIPGVPLIPMSVLADHMDELPDGPLAILCRSGARSARVSEYLTSLGTHGEVANLDGGIIAWAREGLPYEGAEPS